MAKRETKQTYQDVRGDRQTVMPEYNAYQTQTRENAGNIAPFVAAGRERLEAGIGGGMGGGAGMAGGVGQAGPTERTSGRSSVPVSTGRLGDVYGKFGEIADTGGYTPETRASILENVQGLKEIGKTGGYDAENTARARGLGGFEQIQNEGGLSPEAQARMRGGGGYDEFAQTGGYSPTDIANIRSRATSAVGSLGTGLREQMDRQRALQGGYGPGMDAGARALQRDTARNIAGTSLDADIAMKEKINQGRQWGIGGMAGSEGQLQGLRTGNILGATQGLSQAELAMVANRTGSQLRGLESASQVESDLSARIAQLRLQGMSGQQATAQAIAEVEGGNLDRTFREESFNAGEANTTARSNAANATSSSNAGMGNAMDLYRMDMAQYQAERDRELGLLGEKHRTNQGYYPYQTGLAQQPGVGGNIMNLIGSGAGIAAGWFGGGGNRDTQPNPGQPSTQVPAGGGGTATMPTPQPPQPPTNVTAGYYQQPDYTRTAGLGGLGEQFTTGTEYLYGSPLEYQATRRPRYMDTGFTLNV